MVILETLAGAEPSGRFIEKHDINFGYSALRVS